MAAKRTSFVSFIVLQVLAGVVMSSQVEVCPLSMDVVFLLDGSASVGSGNFNQLKEFIISVMKHFTISTTGSHVGVVLYSSSAATKLSFLQRQDVASVSRVIRSIAYPRGNTYTARGLTQSRTVFVHKNGGRSFVSQVLVVITDGINSGGSLVTSSKPLKDDGIAIISLGIGSGIRESELYQIASSSAHVYKFANVVDVNNNVRKVAVAICGANRKSQLYFKSTVKQVALTNHVITSGHVTDDLECAFQCLHNVRCFSFNFRPSSGICQLNYSTKSASSDDVIPDVESTYYGMTFSVR